MMTLYVEYTANEWLFNIQNSEVIMFESDYRAVLLYDNDSWMLYVSSEKYRAVNRYKLRGVLCNQLHLLTVKIFLCW